MKKFASANLSESYDHGGLGLRRSLATGASALLEYPARGVFGGLLKVESDGQERTYDVGDPDDTKDAWNDFLQEIVYSDMIDKLFEKVAETDELADHEPMVQAAHEYILINVASVLHYVFIEAPDAVYAQKLLNNILKLVPWTVLRQSLRIGNAASMINAVTRLFLTKLSVTSITNWLGLSNNPDDGMNLLQQYVIWKHLKDNANVLAEWSPLLWDGILPSIRRSSGSLKSPAMRPAMIILTGLTTTLTLRVTSKRS
jgi:hypothetical protein